MKRIQQYLYFLKNNSFSIGSYIHGEIEIVTDVQKILSIEQEMRVRLKKNNLPEEWSEIGIVYEDQYCIIIRDAVVFPTGNAGTYIRIMPKSQLNGAPGVVILPVLDSQIILHRSYRHAIRDWEIAVPRGFGEIGEDILGTARRELQEETGYTIANIYPLGIITPDTGLMGSIVHIYYAEVNQIKERACHEYSEAISNNLILATPEELDKMIYKGEIIDGYTICAFSLAKIKGYLP
ncbi:NUDIX hydrolase [bacterium]|nr:NUDIX hydrolase [bacterium]